MKKKDFLKNLEEIYKKKNVHIENLRKRIPKNLIIEGISDKKIHIVNEYLKTRENLGFNFSELSSHFGENWNYEEYPLGNIMRNTDNNAIVGFMATIYSKRQINNNEVVCCNLAHWYVEKEFRMFAYAFFLPLLNKKIIIYSHTPKISIVSIYKKLGFDIKIMKYTVGFSINVNSIFSKNYKRFVISDHDKEVENALNAQDRRIYQDHKKYNCIHFIILDKKKILKPCYIVAKKVKRYRMGVLDILYISDLEKFNQYGPEISTKISLFFNKIFIGQRYFHEKEKFKYNPSFLTKTVDKFFPIKSFNNYYIFDTLYSDHVLFDI